MEEKKLFSNMSVEEFRVKKMSVEKNRVKNMSVEEFTVKKECQFSCIPIYFSTDILFLP